jgi:hypothetical protein
MTHQKVHKRFKLDNNKRRKKLTNDSPRINYVSSNFANVFEINGKPSQNII